MIAPGDARVRFMIGGVQKGGTTALAHYLSAHPKLRLPVCKEAHVFDAPDYDDSASVEAVDARFAPLFDGGFHADAQAVHGDATPISIFLPRVVSRIARYNPAMRWIVLLRDPVERAISQYYMEFARGDERLPLPCALLAEHWRLRGHDDDLSPDSPLRHHSYLARGRYTRQLEHLFAAFPAEQLLLLRSDDLRHRTEATLTRVHRHLGLEPRPSSESREPVFAGNYGGRVWPKLVRPVLRAVFRRERRALKAAFGIDLD